MGFPVLYAARESVIREPGLFFLKTYAPIHIIGDRTMEKDLSYVGGNAGWIRSDRHFIMDCISFPNTTGCPFLSL